MSKKKESAWNRHLTATITYVYQVELGTEWTPNINGNTFLQNNIIVLNLFPNHTSIYKD